MKKLVFGFVITTFLIIGALTAVFAWFNLSIKNESNFRISDFDIEILISDNESTFITPLQPNEPLFDFDGKYSLEPGDNQTKYLKIINNGDIPVAYELLFNGVGDFLGDYIFVDIEKQGVINSLKGNELSSARFGAGEELRQNDYVIYKLSVTFNASLEEVQMLKGETFKLETIVSAWQFNYEESKPTISTTETVEVLDHTYAGWVDGTDNIVISYDTSDITSIKIEPRGVNTDTETQLFVEYIKIDGIMIDIEYESGDENGYQFSTVPLIKDVATFSGYKYTSNVLSIRVFGEGQSQGEEYIEIDLNEANTLEIYLRCIEKKEYTQFIVTKQ